MILGIDALFMFKPADVFVRMASLALGIGMVAPVIHLVPVVYARLDPALRAGEVKLSDETASVAGNPKNRGEKPFVPSKLSFPSR